MQKNLFPKTLLIILSRFLGIPKNAKDSQKLDKNMYVKRFHQRQRCISHSDSREELCISTISIDWLCLNQGSSRSKNLNIYYFNISNSALVFTIVTAVCQTLLLLLTISDVLLGPNKGKCALVETRNLNFPVWTVPWKN